MRSMCGLNSECVMPEIEKEILTSKAGQTNVDSTGPIAPWTDNTVCAGAQLIDQAFFRLALIRRNMF